MQTFYNESSETVRLPPDAEHDTTHEHDKTHDSSQIGLSFQKLGCHGSMASDLIQDTVLTYALSLPRQLMAMVRRRRQTQVQILRDFNGLVRTGEMLLVLGRPGSGCSTLLKTVAGNTHGFHIDRDSSMLYNGVPYHHVHRAMKGECVYLSELDVHFPELTVGQTLAFAAATRPASSGAQVSAVARSGASSVARSVASSFSLDNAYDTKLGNAMIRGVSGGEKRRTSLAEAYISGARFQCWDNSTRGLDSMTSLDFVTLLRGAVSDRQLVVLMSIYQASEAIFKTFDKVTLLYEGRQIYFGPVDEACAFFMDMGFERPSHATSADFLSSLTNPAERVVRKGFESRAPRSPDEFARAWQECKQARAILAEIEMQERGHGINYYGPRTRGKKQFPTSTYPTPIMQQILFCIRRGFLRLRNNYAPVVAGVVANTVIAIVVGSVFYNLGQSTDSMNKRAVLLFFSLMITAFAPAFEIITMWAQRPVMEKHDRYAFYHPFAESLASVVCDLPNKLATSLLFHIALYFMTNLRRSASAFCTYYVFNVAVLLTMSMLFRMIGSLSKTLEQTMAPVSIMVVIFIAYTGFVIPADYMVAWLKWLRWLNPLAYAYESLMVNEDRQFACSSYVPVGPSYGNGVQGKTCMAVGATEGQLNVQGTSYLALKYRFTSNHLWRNLGIIVAMMVIFCIIYLLASEYIPAERSKGEILVFKKRESRIPPKSDDCEAGPTPLFPPRDGDEKRQSPVPPRPSHSGQPPVLHWHNLDYDVKAKGGKRRILREVNGWLKPGTLTVLMGVTGAGKTTLLDLLAQRFPPGRSGHVYIGQQLCDANFQRKLGYVQQEDIHLPTATVREALMFSALLRQAEEMSATAIAEHVEHVIDMLEMGEYAEAVVGVPGQGLNLEQRKRLSIAVELVTKPEFFLFLDEPTSGLDSQTAWSIGTLLRKLTQSGQAILCTAHQPSAQILQMFDRLLLLSSRGETIYFGDIGPAASTMTRYFESHGAPPCAPSSNPAEWMMSVTKEPGESMMGVTKEPAESMMGVTKDPADMRSGIESWAQRWETSGEKRRVMRQLQELSEAIPQSVRAVGRNAYAASLARQTLLVSKRVFQNYWRDPIYLYSKMALCLGVALANGLSFKSTLDIQGLTNSLFSIFLLTQLFSTIDQQVIPRLTATRALFESRERPSKTYSWVAFLLATIFVEIAFQTLASVLVFVCWYYPTGMWRHGDAQFSTSERGALVFVLLWLFGLWITTFSQAVAVAIEHAETAVQIATLFFWLSLVFCGVIVSPDNLPGFWVFVYRASPLTYLVNGLVVAGLAGTHVTCSTATLVRIIPVDTAATCGQYLDSYMRAAGGYLANPAARDLCLYCPISDTDAQLRSMGMHVNYKWRVVGFMAAYVAFNIVATIVIYWAARGPGRRFIARCFSLVGFGRKTD